MVDEISDSKWVPYDAVLLALEAAMEEGYHFITWRERQEFLLDFEKNIGELFFNTEGEKALRNLGKVEDHDDARG